MGDPSDNKIIKRIFFLKDTRKIITLCLIGSGTEIILISEVLMRECHVYYLIIWKNLYAVIFAE
jgi:hypothetical protein